MIFTRFQATPEGDIAVLLSEEVPVSDLPGYSNVTRFVDIMDTGGLQWVSVSEGETIFPRRTGTLTLLQALRSLSNLAAAVEEAIRQNSVEADVK